MPLTLQETDTKLLDAVTVRVSQELPTLLSDVQLSAEDGIVTVSGSLSTHTEHSRMTEIIRKTPAVRAVIDRIGMSSAGSAADWTLANDVLAALAAKGHMKEGQIKVTVRDGFVVLDGTVRWNCSRLDAGTCIAHIPGLKGVCNRLTLERRTAT